MPSKTRLFLDHPLSAGQTVPLAEGAANYLFAVMRLAPGAVISVFNGRDGEWDAAVTPAGKRAGLAVIGAQTRAQTAPPDLWLLFAPVKKARTDFIVEKAVELGAARILPVLTERTNGERFNTEKQILHAIEAAEQCGATHVPEVAAPVRLTQILDRWDDRPLWFCDETLLDLPAAPPQDGPRGALLIGPEGGFTDAERARLNAAAFAHPVSLGPRILRAETAALAAMTLWQATNGDWR